MSNLQNCYFDMKIVLNNRIGPIKVSKINISRVKSQGQYLGQILIFSVFSIILYHFFWNFFVLCSTETCLSWVYHPDLIPFSNFEIMCPECRSNQKVLQIQCYWVPDFLRIPNLKSEFRSNFRLTFYDLLKTKNVKFSKLLFWP